MQWLRRRWCRLFHSKWRATVCLDDAAQCEREGRYNRTRSYWYCPRCDRLFPRKPTAAEAEEQAVANRQAEEIKQ